jgi:hypothetical protein
MSSSAPMIVALFCRDRQSDERSGFAALSAGWDRDGLALETGACRGLPDARGVSRDGVGIVFQYEFRLIERPGRDAEKDRESAEQREGGKVTRAAIYPRLLNPIDAVDP